MNRIARRTALQWMLAGATAAGLAACGGGDDDPTPTLTVDANGYSTFDLQTLSAILDTYPTPPLSAEEIASLLFMREEEMLAHAVYAASAVRWPTPPIFGNIAQSESTHAAAVKLLLDRYGLADPLAGLPVGTFASTDFQMLYDTLVAASDVSLIEALKVGVQIEELDIRDIEAQKADVTHSDILLVYDNLLRGSRNHLRAFMKVLTLQGGTYVPQYITQEAFDAIVDSPMETGR